MIILYELVDFTEVIRIKVVSLLCRNVFQQIRQRVAFCVFVFAILSSWGSVGKLR